MKFEYDSKKSQLNRQKHGISLEEAKELWLVIGIEIRLISARRSRREEEKIYEEKIKNEETREENQGN